LNPTEEKHAMIHPSGLSPFLHSRFSVKNSNAAPTVRVGRPFLAARRLSSRRWRYAQRAGALDVVNVADSAPGPEAGLVREQQGARLRRAVHSLPLIYRQVVTLMLEDMGYDEIAQVLGISESNVGARLSRARQMLRELMEIPR
jgi:RNA polymerase sigma-70 factor (ECF subfamily)